MKCHYDVLSVDREANDDEIKKSYRKLALLYHPDKNPDNPEVVELFREVQSAYDVLSDKQERAWYDKNREAILKGGDDYVDDAIDLMQYFNPSVYSGFDDGPDSFYTIFRDLFVRLGKEDESSMDHDEFELVPEFGFCSSDYETVVKPFYVYWLAYRTKRSYAWKQVYDIRTAANRPTQRLMEKDNKKLRDSCRKKRNEEVRTLVMYVRKRDKRVQEEVKRMNEKQEESKRKAKEIQEMQKLDRSKMLDNYEEQEWMAFDSSKLDHIDSEFNEMFGSVINGDTDESDNENYLYCIACDKNFKSDKALANHEKSKKHKENVNLIKNELEGDILDGLCISDAEVGECGNNMENNDVNGNSSLNGMNDSTSPSVKRSKKKKKKKRCGWTGMDSDSEEKVEDYNPQKNITVGQENKKDVILDVDSNDDSTLNENVNLQENENDLGAVCDIDSDCDSSKQAITETTIGEDDETAQLDSGEKSETASVPVIKETECSEHNNSVFDDDERGSFGCEVCPKVFPTRNKLFKHIKSQGHAVLKEQPKKSKSRKGKGKK